MYMHRWIYLVKSGYTHVYISFHANTSSSNAFTRLDPCPSGIADGSVAPMGSHIERSVLGDIVLLPIA